VPKRFNRAYRRPVGAIGSREKWLGLAFLVILIGVIAAFVISLRKPAPAPPAQPQSALTPASPSANPLPALADRAWESPPTAERFTREDMHLKIDGRADAYIENGAVGLSFGRYQHRFEPQRAVDVYLYEFDSPDAARHMYDRERPLEAEKLELGDEAYAAGGAVFLCEGRHYVQILPSSLSAADATVARQVAQGIVAVIGLGS
jgi:hypothetical protein